MHFCSLRTVRRAVPVLFLLAAVSLAEPLPAPAARSRAHRYRSVPLRYAIPRILKKSSASGAHWGISVVSLSGRPLYEHNQDQYFHPASNAKLFTTAAAFALLPPDLTFTTQVVTNGSIDPSGILHGNLTILGVGGDNMSGRKLPYDGRTERPNPPLGALQNMADQIVKHGIHAVTGDIVGDDTWFPRERYATGWTWDDLQWGYGAPVSALTVNDNVVYLNLAPAAKAGEPAVVSWTPATSYYTLENSLMTVAGGERKVGVDREPGSMTVRIYGQIPLDAQPENVALAIQDPADYAARSFKEMLVARGVQIGGVARAQHRFLSSTTRLLEEQQQPLDLDAVTLKTVAAVKPGATVLATHVSPPIGEDLVVTNKVSQNLHAEIILRTLGKLEGADGSIAEGTRVVRQFLIAAGVKPNDFIFYDGSGLSTEDLVTPRAFTTLLVYAAKQSWGNRFRGSLPDGGVDGTLAGRFKSRLLRGKVFAKTGTLAEDTSLSGYLTTQRGRTVIFSILCSDHLPGSPSAEDTVDQIVAAIARAE